MWLQIAFGGPKLFLFEPDVDLGVCEQAIALRVRKDFHRVANSEEGGDLKNRKL